MEVGRKEAGRMRATHLRQTAVFMILCGLLLGCATERNRAAPVSAEPPRRRPAAVAAPVPAQPKEITRGPWVGDMGWKTRTISEEEISGLYEKDPSLTHSAYTKMLARLNTRAHYYIYDDIKAGRSLKVPNDLSAFKHWTPMPRNLPEASGVPKFILVAKDIPFIGWYDNGQLTGDTYICIGKSGQWTEAGLFQVEEKDVSHHSKSYPNSFGLPAWMPYAMRIYGAVWIHAGDITGPQCSHGCVTLPLEEAQTLFNWTDAGTFVLILESLNDLPRDLEKFSPHFQAAR
jgi:lipoprotein-anchoring transpeptidase ErfK/SrfK